MRLSLLTTGLPPFAMGGMQTHSLNMIAHLSRGRVDLDVYHAVPEQTSGVRDKLTEQLPLNVSIHHFDVPRRRRYPGHYIVEAKVLSSAYLKHYLHLQASDVIYAKGLMATSFIDARRKQGMSLPPIITNVHGYEAFQPAATFMEAIKNSLLRPAFRLVVNHSDYVVSYGGRITELLRDRLGVSSGRIIEIPGAVDDQFLSTPTLSEVGQPRRFAFVGRYERRKGLEELAPLLHQGVIADHEFHVIGPIPESVIKQFPSTVRFHGKVSDRSRLIKLLDSIDVLVCPSWSEGMPNVIMEAMARSTAVVATDVGATRLLVDHNNGRLIQPRQPNTISKAIQELVLASDEELAAMKAKSKRRISDRFTWRTVGPQLARLIDEVVATPTGRSEAA